MAETKIEPLNQPENKPEGFIVKLLQNKSLLINVVFSIVLFGVTIGFINTKMNRKQVKNASLAYSSLNQQNQIQPQADIQKLAKIANKYSFLRPHLDAPMVQECLNRGELKMAKTFHDRIESRLSPHLDFLFKFNQVSFLITEQNYEEALKLSYSLKEEINPVEQPTLFSYHLLRIATLERKLDHADQYVNRLNDFALFNSSSEYQRDSLRLGSLSLSEFMIERSKRQNQL